MPSCLKVLSYNILNPYHAVKWGTLEGIKAADANRASNWSVRKDQLFKNMCLDANVLCLQEVNIDTFNFLKNTLTDTYAPSVYGFHTSASSVNLPEGHHGQAQFYKQAKNFALAQTRIFYFNQATYRIAAWAVYTYGGLRVGILNVHLKGYDLALPPTSVAAQIGNEEIVSYLQQLENTCDVTLIIGDFNADVDAYNKRSKRFLTLENQGFSPLMFKGSTCNGEAIDWAFLKIRKEFAQKGLVQGRAYIPEVHYPQASDHKPIVVELQFNEGALSSI